SGPAASVALPIAVDGEIGDALEAALEAMHFERPAYSGGAVALVTPVALAVDAEVAIEVEGDFMSLETPTRFAFSLPAGATRLPIADTEALPADFLHLHVTRKV